MTALYNNIIIIGGGGSSRPLDKGDAQSPKNMSSLWSSGEEAGPPGPSPGSTTVFVISTSSMSITWPLWLASYIGGESAADTSPNWETRGTKPATIIDASNFSPRIKSNMQSTFLNKHLYEIHVGAGPKNVHLSEMRLLICENFNVQWNLNSWGGLK